MSPTERARPASSRTSIASWVTTGVLAAGLVYTVLQVGLNAPYLAPAGHGFTLRGESMLAGAVSRRINIARPPDFSDAATRSATIADVRPGSPADAAHLRAGQRILGATNVRTGESVESPVKGADIGAWLSAWRQAYRIGLRGDLRLRVAAASGDAPVAVTIQRPPVWAFSADIVGAWVLRHGGRVAQLLCFMTAACVLLLLRTSDATARFAVLAFVFCAVSNIGSLVGAERALPRGTHGIMTLFSWLAMPLAFPSVCLAILYFPRKSPVLARHRWLHVVPFAAALPILAPSLGTGLYVAGVDSAAPIAVWDATHPRVFFLAFALALALNVAAISEGWDRFRRTTDPVERRRVQMAFYTTLPATIAYAIIYGVPAAAYAVGGTAITLPAWIALPLEATVLLPAIGVPYAVIVHRVMEPRVVLRRGLQYALARRTLSALVVLPAAALAASLIGNRNRSLAEIVTGQPLFYAATLSLLALGMKYRDRARAWLDRRFFREEYDARQVLLSLASRIPFETDPNELTALVLQQVDTALHPEMAAVLVAGLEEGALSPVSVLNGRVGPLPARGGLATLLEWSDEPLETYPDDPRSTTRRLPPDEQRWLSETGAVLLVPMFAGQGSDRAARTLLGVLVLGGKRSDEPYTPEDRELLSSIAAQVALALDVARLRQQQSAARAVSTTETVMTTAVAGLTECPRCGRCDDAGVDHCPDDGSAMRLVIGLPRLADGKYRIDRVIGRGGMGAVFRARDMRLDRDVALKVVRAELLSDPGARTRFRREAQLVARLQHPSIVSVFDYGTLPDGGAFLVMELVRGRDLRKILRERGRFPPDAAVRLMRAICGAVDAAHAAGVLHRDLKPENILLPDEGIEAKVLDFGVAKLVSETPAESAQETLTVAGTPIGTPAYMAPEQLAGAAVSARTDLFSLGVMCYELLTGELPFGPGPLLDIAHRQQCEDLAGELVVHGVPAPIKDAVLWALRPNPSERPSSAGELAAALNRGLTAV
jgi:GAF domain-containing protein